MAVVGTIGNPDDDYTTCHLDEALQSSDLELPLRYQVFGINPNQVVPLHMTLGVTGAPEDWVEADVHGPDLD